jgi:guanylate kinase
MNKRPKRLIIVGKGGSGKDYMRKILELRGFKYCVSHTTRPPREGEINGKDYYFITEDEANRDFIEKGLFYEYVSFNDWIYGTSIDEFISSDLFIMTPSGLSSMEKLDREESFVVYLDIDEKTRRERLSSRNDADVLERRLGADREDFLKFSDFDARITDPFFTDLGEWGNLKFYGRND